MEKYEEYEEIEGKLWSIKSDMDSIDFVLDKLNQNSESCHCQFSFRQEYFKNPNAQETVPCLRLIL